MNYQDENQGSILQRIADGSLSLSSKTEYQDLITLFPDKADIKRAYADFLSQNGEDQTAYPYYVSAADLYIKDGKTIQAVVATILAWRIIKPTHQEGRTFHAALQANQRGESPLQYFFTHMPYAEFIAVMLRLTRLQLPAGETIISAGDNCDDLFFIVSGDIEEIFQPSPAAKPSASQRLADNDIFGEVFPLNEKRYAQSDVKTLTHAELVKIPKSALIEISAKYPLIEQSLTKLLKDPSGRNQGRTWVSVRRSTRHMTPVKINLEITLASKPEGVLNIEAMSKDISAGGVCVDLGLTHGSLSIGDFAGSGVTSSIELPHVNKSLSIPGTIIWIKKLKEPAGVSMLAGIKFEALRRETHELLNVYCFGIDNEQTLMWSLWETYMS